MPESEKFSPEIHEQAARRVQEHRAGARRYEQRESIGPDVSCAPQTPFEEVRQSEVDAGGHFQASAGPKRIKGLTCKVQELRRDNEILKLVSALFAQTKLDRRLK